MKRLLSIAILLFSVILIILIFRLYNDNTSNDIPQFTAEQIQEFKNIPSNKVYVSSEYTNALSRGLISDNYIILECSWGNLKNSKLYKKAHIKGAIHINTDDIEDSENWNIKDPNEIKEVLYKYGITKDTKVLCYSNTAVDTADDRVAVALLWAGVEDVKCLDGGFTNYLDKAYKVEKKINKATSNKKDFGCEIPKHPEYIIDVDDVKKELANNPRFKLVSIRSRDEFLGKTSGYSYIHKAGEPLGAIWGHDTDDGSYLNNGKMAGIDTICRYLAESNASLDNDLVFYCGTGWRASVPFLILYENNISTRIFDGGWYIWQKDDENWAQLGNVKTKVKDITIK